MFGALDGLTQGAADHGRTLISDTTYERIKHKIEATPRAEPLKLKGKSKVVHAYTVTRFLDS